MPIQKTKDLTDQFSTNGGNDREIKKIPCVSRINVERWSLATQHKRIAGDENKTHTHALYSLYNCACRRGEICYGFFLFE